MSTVQDVIDSIISHVPEGPFADTIDTIKLGSPHSEVTGIVTTFLATDRIIHFAADKGANLVITHEPVFYSHNDETGWLAASPVMKAKRDFARESGITIWRCHDYAHAMKPDIIVEGVIDALSWERHRTGTGQAGAAELFELSHRPRPAALANEIKSALATSRVLLAGDPDTQCRRVALLVGAIGGRHQIEATIAGDVDALVVGEVNEWEAPEYFRDAAFGKSKKALLVVGHQPSEEAGMARLAGWLGERFPDIPIQHRSAGDPLRVI